MSAPFSRPIHGTAHIAKGQIGRGEPNVHRTLAAPHVRFVLRLCCQRADGRFGLGQNRFDLLGLDAGGISQAASEVENDSVDGVLASFEIPLGVGRLCPFRRELDDCPLPPLPEIDRRPTGDDRGQDGKRGQRPAAALWRRVAARLPGGREFSCTISIRLCRATRIAYRVAELIKTEATLE